MRVRAGDVFLHATEHGRGQPLLLLHGFTGSIADWSSHLPLLAGSFRVIAVDLLGHGLSDAPADAARYRMERCVDDLAAVLDRFAVERAACAGYSMGGRVALGLALAHPERVRALVLEGASPGIEDPDERRRRLLSDLALADRLEHDGIEKFVGEWMRQPLFASQARLGAEALGAQRRRRCAGNATGLANSLRGLGTGAQPSFWGRLGDIEAPALLIAGAEDEKFRAVAAAMAQRMRGSETAAVPAAGHNTHLENPVEFGRAANDFLRRVCAVPGREEHRDAIRG